MEENCGENMKKGSDDDCVDSSKSKYTPANDVYLHDIARESREMMNFIIDTVCSSDSERLKNRVQTFYRDFDNDIPQSEEHNKIIDKLFNIWKSTKEHGLTSKDTDKLFNAYSSFFKKVNPNNSLLFEDFLKLWSYMKYSPDLDDPEEKAENLKKITIETPYSRNILTPDVIETMKSWGVRKLADYDQSSKRKGAEQIILPKRGKRNILITSALPYVNNVPHLGNIIGCVLSGDCYNRYCRLRGYNSLYICGTDEYGTATEVKATTEGISCLELCDRYHELHASIYEWFNIKFDHFGRTTTSKQTHIVQGIFMKLHAKKYFLNDKINQLYCASCSRYLADRFVEGICPHCKYDAARGDQCDLCGKVYDAIELVDPKCKLCNSAPEIKQSNHLFFDLPRIVSELASWVKCSQKEGKWSNNAIKITQSWLNEGLKPRCVTRDLNWGTPVPVDGFTNKVFYVWFDACIGYISITASYTPEAWKQWWIPEENSMTKVKLVQFMAKDNVPFHTIIFPASLIGTGDSYTMLSDISCTEYLTYEGEKFSKSRGVGVFGDNAKESGLPADLFRFYLLANRPEGQDTNFSWSDLIAKNNGDLLNNLGNFFNRTVKFLNSHYESSVPALHLVEEDAQFLCAVNAIYKDYIEAMENHHMRDSVKYTLEVSRCANIYWQRGKPWKLVQSENNDDKERCNTIVAVSCNICALLASMVYPFMPMVSNKMCEQLNIDTNLLHLSEEFERILSEEHKIGQAATLFTKYPETLAAELKAKFGGNKSKIDVALDYLRKVDVKIIETKLKGHIRLIEELKLMDVNRDQGCEEKMEPQLSKLINQLTRIVK